MSQEKDLFETKEEKDLFAEDKPASAAHKDLWLFLIILDAVLLCVFGFYLYKNLYSRLLPAPQAAIQPETVVEEVETGVAEQIEPALPPQAKPEPAPQPAAKPEPQTPETPVAPAEQVSVVPAADAAQPAEEQPAAQDTKQSIFINNTGGRYRQVTFRYYGEAKSAAVVSGFTMAKPREMKKTNGYWETTLSIAPGTYKYLLVVDGKQITDPYAPQQDGRSVLIVK